MAKHTCHAHGCTTAVRPKMFMCRPHWFKLPKNLRDAIWREYRPGQEIDKRPSYRYLAVQQLAISRAAFRPNDEQAAATAAGHLVRALAWRRMAIEDGDGDPLDGLVSEGEDGE